MLGSAGEGKDMPTAREPTRSASLGLGLALALVVEAGASAECLDYGTYVRQVGHVDTPCPAVGAAIVGGHAYLADADSGLVVVDVSNPIAPEVIASLPRLAGSQAVAVSGSYAYSADAFGLSVADVSDPMRPRYLGHAHTMGSAGGVAVRDTLAYLAENMGLDVLDVSEPAKPRVVATIGLSDAWDVSLLGPTAFVTTYEPERLYAVDISEPLSPRLVGTMPVTMPQEAVTCHGYLYVVDYLAGLEIFDVSKPSSPQIVGTLPYGGAGWVAVSDTIACLGARGRTALVDVANPKAPRIIGYAETGGATAVSGTKAYVVESAGLDIIDFTNPHSPPISANLALSGNAMDVVVSGPNAYVADNAGGVRIVDVSTPTSPRLIDTVATPDHAYAVATAGKYLYAADYSAGLQVIDLSSPAAAHIVGSVSLPGEAYDVEVSGDRAYVAGLDAGLEVVDISNPLSPTYLGRVGLPDYAIAVALSGTTAYVAAQAAGLRVVDCSKPTAPRVIGTLDTPDWAGGIAIEGTTVYLTYDGGFDLVDVSNPSAPQLVGTTSSPGYADAVVPAGNYAYLADFFGGVQVVDIRNPSAPVTVGTEPVGANSLVLYRGYLLDVDASGLHVLSTQCDPSVAVTVYPGDTNNDGLVDIRDVLPLGLYFGLTGPARTDASMRWGPQVLSTSWAGPDDQADYADCDGDGVVDAGDILAVIQNWGARIGQPPPDTDRRAVCEELLVELDQNAECRQHERHPECGSRLPAKVAGSTHGLPPRAESAQSVRRRNRLDADGANAGASRSRDLRRWRTAGLEDLGPSSSGRRLRDSLGWRGPAGAARASRELLLPVHRGELPGERSRHGDSVRRWRPTSDSGPPALPVRSVTLRADGAPTQPRHGTATTQAGLTAARPTPCIQNVSTRSELRISPYSSVMVDTGQSAEPAEPCIWRHVPQARIRPPAA